MQTETTRPAHILVVDDDPDDQEMARMAIDESGLPSEVTVLTDGARFIEYLEDPARTVPDMVLLDINMPRMDGYAVLEQVKQDDRFRALPIIMLTTSRAQEDVNRCYQLGCNSYISKPMLYETLVELMRMLRAYWVDSVERPDIRKLIEDQLGRPRDTI